MAAQIDGRAARSRARLRDRLAEPRVPPDAIAFEQDVNRYEITRSAWRARR